jgi:hypothetical protein
MYLDASVLCKSVELLADEDWVNLIGVFDVMTFATLPALAPPCSLFIRLRFMPNEFQTHRLDLRTVDEDGRVVAPPLTVVEKGRGKSRAPYYVLTYWVKLAKFRLEHFGVYAFHLDVDDQEVGVLAFQVVREPMSRRR